MSNRRFRIPLRNRLKVFLANKALNNKSLSGGWHTGEGKDRKWHWVPDFHQSRGGNKPFKMCGRTLLWTEDVSGTFRVVFDYGDKGNGRKYEAWYVDNYQQETTSGFVVKCTTRNGKERFHAGVWDPWNPNTGMIDLDPDWDLDTAKRNASNLTERYAEEVREDEAKESAKLQIEEKKSEIKDLREEIRDLISGIRESTLSEVICDEIRQSIRSRRRDIRDCWKKIADLEENYWEAVPN